jgi:hypothetical protein
VTVFGAIAALPGLEGKVEEEGVIFAGAAVTETGCIVGAIAIVGVAGGSIKTGGVVAKG